ncbi:MAG: response regulator, partial [Verrucomicrobia bacterium]|nr:response regulator [Verrucomicrobiota bacterium]
GGTGLGLAISRRIVELMGGRMGLESMPGQGSLFWFEIALEVAPAPAAEPEASAASQAGSAPGAASVRPLRILVAEDYEPNQRLAMYMLESLGYRADFAANGRAAIEAWERSAYDVIMMDCQMPVMDGFEATREIRRLEAARSAGRRERTCIVALTAHSVKGHRERCLAAGMDGYLTKPYTAQQLGAALKQHPAPSAHPVRFDPQRLAQLRTDIGDRGGSTPLHPLHPLLPSVSTSSASPSSAPTSATVACGPSLKVFWPIFSGRSPRSASWSGRGARATHPAWRIRSGASACPWGWSGSARSFRKSRTRRRPALQPAWPRCWTCCQPLPSKPKPTSANGWRRPPKHRTELRFCADSLSLRVSVPRLTGL